MVAWRRRRHLSLAHIPICGGKGTRGRRGEGATSNQPSRGSCVSLYNECEFFLVPFYQEP